MLAPLPIYDAVANSDPRFPSYDVPVLPCLHVHVHLRVGVRNGDSVNGGTAGTETADSGGGALALRLADAEAAREPRRVRALRRTAARRRLPLLHRQSGFLSDVSFIRSSLRKSRSAPAIVVFQFLTATVSLHIRSYISLFEFFHYNLRVEMKKEL